MVPKNTLISSLPCEAQPKAAAAYLLGRTNMKTNNVLASSSFTLVLYEMFMSLLYAEYLCKFQI